MDAAPLAQQAPRTYQDEHGPLPVGPPIDKDGLAQQVAGAPAPAAGAGSGGGSTTARLREHRGRRGQRGAAGPSGTTHEAVDASRYYNEYHGHPYDQLSTVVRSLRTQGKRLVWLAGDSSLDNKYWFSEAHPAVNGYEHILRPPEMKADVCYWLNKQAAETHGGPPLACVNTALEATALNDRSRGQLWMSDKLIRDNIGSEDVLIVSVGGNDVALQPVRSTSPL